MHIGALATYPVTPLRRGICIIDCYSETFLTSAYEELQETRPPELSSMSLAVKGDNRCYCKLCAIIIEFCLPTEILFDTVEFELTSDATLRLAGQRLSTRPQTRSRCGRLERRGPANLRTVSGVGSNP